MIICGHVLICSVASKSLRPKDFSPPGSSVHGDSPGKNLDKIEIISKHREKLEQFLRNKKSSTLPPGKPSGSRVKNPSAKQETLVQSLAQEEPWRRKCTPFQYSYLGNPMDRGPWRATVHGVQESDTI